jgi:cellulose synthase/poly-beta-1,6-N-acetylglucosamine synthase-like glycosyltransferase
MIPIILFGLCLFIVVYAYAGYTLVLIAMAGVRRLACRKVEPDASFEPSVTLFIPAYNEAGFIGKKMENIMSLQYPRDKLKVIWITDGSNDDSEILLKAFPGITVMHLKERLGKVHAMNRGMQQAETPIVLFTDANTMLNLDALHRMVQYFADSRVGCVSGEKKILGAPTEKAVGAREGLYWKYESLIKRLESETGSTVGAVGELFAFRRELYEPVNEDTLLDDFTISLSIAQKGYAIKYAPEAQGTETASVSVSEEMKRKVRIAAGGMQTLFRMPSLLNPFRNRRLAFRYISHKVLRWTLVPLCFPLLFLLNAIILLYPAPPFFYTLFFILQVVFYLVVLTGALLHNVRLRFKPVFAPYYLMVMNYAMLVGMLRYLRGKYSVNWEKAVRA